LALKALESDGLDLDDAEMGMLARKVIKLLKKAGWQFKEGSTSKARSSDHNKLSGCFKCRKHDYVVKSKMKNRGQNSSETMPRSRNKVTLQNVSQRL